MPLQLLLDTFYLPEAHPIWKREKQLVLDPSVPEVLELVRTDIARLRAWGYTLIKHDFTTFDITGRWGLEMADGIFSPAAWNFADRSRTTAEIILALYRVIREAAGDVILIGCNTVGHLSAGLFELQRTGDDTSGLDWERTRKMGINTLAFRMCQHETFFAADADCVGLTQHVPWALNRQWLELLAASGTPLFVSADPAAVGPEQRASLKAALARAARAQPPAEAVDWQETTCPRHWRFGHERRVFAFLRHFAVPFDNNQSAFSSFRTSPFSPFSSDSLLHRKIPVLKLMGLSKWPDSSVNVMPPNQSNEPIVLGMLHSKAPSRPRTASIRAQSRSGHLRSGAGIQLT